MKPTEKLNAALFLKQAALPLGQWARTLKAKATPHLSRYKELLSGDSVPRLRREAEQAGRAAKAMPAKNWWDFKGPDGGKAERNAYETARDKLLQAFYKADDVAGLENLKSTGTQVGTTAGGLGALGAFARGGRKKD